MYIFPIISLLAGLFIMAMPLHSLSQNTLITPFIFSAIIFYWALRTPHALPPVVVFFAGIATDIFTGTPMGYWVLSYIAIYAIGFYLHKYSENIRHIFFWGLFGLASLIVGLFSWMVASTYLFKIQAISPYSVAWGYAFLAFPFLAVFLGNLRRLNNARTS